MQQVYFRTECRVVLSFRRRSEPMFDGTRSGSSVRYSALGTHSNRPIGSSIISTEFCIGCDKVA